MMLVLLVLKFLRVVKLIQLGEICQYPYIKIEEKLDIVIYGF